MAFPPGATIEFHDTGPDELGRRRFTVTWPVEPRQEGFPGRMVLVTRRAQCFFSTQWQEWLQKAGEGGNDSE